MVVPQECRRIGASAFVVFDIVPAECAINARLGYFIELAVTLATPN